MTNTESKWDAEGYWAAVLGVGSEDEVAGEFDLTPDDPRGNDPDDTLEAWLCRAESEAWAAGGLGGPQPAEWAAFHVDALERLTDAAERRAAERRAAEVSP